MTDAPNNADLPNRFRRRRPSLLMWVGGSALLLAGAFAAMLWLAQRPLPDPTIPEPKPHPDDAFVTVVGDSPATEQVLGKALSAYDGGHYRFLFFGENRLPPGRYQLRVFDPPGSVEFEPTGLDLRKRQEVTVRVRLFQEQKDKKVPKE